METPRLAPWGVSLSGLFYQHSAPNRAIPSWATGSVPSHPHLVPFQHERGEEDEARHDDDSDAP